MSIAYKPRKDATKLTVEKGKTLAEVLAAGGLTGQLDLVAQYNWGTKEPAEINRALIELVGCEKFDADPLKTVLDPTRGTGGVICKPEPWTQGEFAYGKTHTVKVKKRLPATGAAIDKLPYFFNPEKGEKCPFEYLLEGDPERVKTADLEVHVASYWGVTGRSSPTVPKPDVEEYVTSYYDEVKAEDVRQGDEYVEKPTGTFTKGNVKETHILKKSEDKPRGLLTFEWDGKSKATEGVLKADALASSRCAPYLVSVRYYKNAVDKTAILRLKPFYPQWKLTGKKKWDLIEDSLIVHWRIEGEETSKAKLTNGQIRLYDKAGLVFFAPLTADQIKNGKYDLLQEAIKWDKSKVEMDNLPYRVQIQVHSNDEEENGLALAVEPTQVPPYNYEKVQLISYDARNDTDATNTDYLGDGDDDTDIDFRVAAMIEAIQKARPVETDRKTLKVFVAPEFYFRGKKGAYAFEKISTIVPKLRKETDKYEYLDWWFVFGTALGSYSHEATGSATEHGNAIHLLTIDGIIDGTEITATVWSAPKQGWELHTKAGQKKTITGPPVWPVTSDKLKFPSTVKLTLSDTLNLAPTTDKIDAWVIEPVMTILDTVPTNISQAKEIIVASAICSQMAVDSKTNKVITVGGTHWEAESGGVVKRITHSTFDKSLKQFKLTLESDAAFQSGKPLILREPKTVEIFNVALMQKGWNAPHMGDGSLREVITYKEDMSHIDYIKDIGITDGQFYDKGGDFRKIRMNYLNDVPFLPTAGAKDIGGASPNVERKSASNVGSEINESGLGGGCVIMVDRVTFGVEVCRDHCVYRLFRFYTGSTVRAGDPLVQVQLIPSWGMSIGCVEDHGKEVAALRNALVFNVDGPRMDAVARVWDTTYSCDEHVTVSEADLGDCSVCNLPLQQMGTSVTAGTSIDVPKSDDPKYFAGMGIVRVFPAKTLPDADVATSPPILQSIINATEEQGFTIKVTLKGSNLSDARWVNIDGEGVSLKRLQIVSDAEVKATLAIAHDAAVGTRKLTVSNLSGPSAASVDFNVALRPAPAIDSVSPPEGFVFNQYNVTLTGRNLLTCRSINYSSSGVFTDGKPAYFDDHIDLKIWLNDTAVIGPCTITVKTAGGSATGVFTVKDRTLPIVDSVTPAVYDHGRRYYGVVVTGTNLNLAQDLTLGDGVVLSSKAIVSSTEIRMDVEVGRDAAVGPRDLIVIPRSGTRAPVAVTITTPSIPSLYRASPDNLDQGLSSTRVLYGNHLLTTNKVTVSGAGVSVGSFSNVTASGLEVVLGADEAAIPGVRDITVTTLGGVSNSVPFTVNQRPAPTLARVTPNYGAAGETVQVKIQGQDLWSHKDLKISGGGITVDSIDKDENRELVATLTIDPGASLGDRNLTVTNHGGVSNALTFKVTSLVPELDSVSPVNGEVFYGHVITLMGRNLNGYTTINISGTGVTKEPATVEEDDEIQLKIILAIGADQTERDITVTTPEGTSNAVKFRVDPRKAPTVSRMAPNLVGRNTGGGCSLVGNDLVESGTITCSTDKITVTGVARHNSNQVKFNIAVAADAPIGIHTITYTNRFGSATTNLTVTA